jgi:16S rRNA G1207 methylase RsmC
MTRSFRDRSSESEETADHRSPEVADDGDLAGPLPPRKAERLLMDLWPQALAGAQPTRVLATTLGRAQAAKFVAARHPAATFVCSLLDAYQADLARSPTAATPDASELPTNLEVRCEADFSFGDLDAAAMPCTSQGDGELTREQLQAAYVALRPGGMLVATTDNPRDTWLGEVVETLGGKVRREAAVDGVGYLVRRADSPPKRIRDYAAEFAFRDGERLLSVVSRPGVFSHRRIDPGARRLIEVMQVGDEDRVLDVGCGWGAVGLAAAARGASVEAIDSNARAVACSQANAERNDVAARFTARLEAYGRTSAPGSFAVVLANPPYYAQFRIAEQFVTAAHDALRIGGWMWVVTKQPAWYLDRLPGDFAEVETVEVKGYAVVAARKRRNR